MIFLVACGGTHRPIAINVATQHPCEAYGYRSPECTEWALAYASWRVEQATGGKCVCGGVDDDSNLRICEGMEVTINKCP